MAVQTAWRKPRCFAGRQAGIEEKDSLEEPQLAGAQRLHGAPEAKDWLRWRGRWGTRCRPPGPKALPDHEDRMHSAAIRHSDNAG